MQQCDALMLVRDFKIKLKSMSHHGVAVTKAPVVYPDDPTKLQDLHLAIFNSAYASAGPVLGNHLAPHDCNLANLMDASCVWGGGPSTVDRVLC